MLPSSAERAGRQAGSGRLLCLALACALAGCAAAGPEPEGAATAKQPGPPEWVVTGRTPEISGWPVCAVGVAGPTYFREDAVEAAVDKARGALARPLQVRIETRSLDIQTERGGRHESQTVMEVASHVNEAVLERSTILGVWYDGPGEGFAKTPQCTYALVCMDQASLPAPLAP